MHDLQSRPSLADAPELLRAWHLSLPASGTDEAAQAPLHDVSFTLRRGEILGVYGLLGAGRTELLEALAGSRQMFSGEVKLAGKPRVTSVVDAVKAGIVLVPEDRQRDGLFRRCQFARTLRSLLSGGCFYRVHERQRAQRTGNALNIAARSLELPVTALSGGNQQKVLIARCLMRSPSFSCWTNRRVAWMSEPRRSFTDILRRLAAEGLGILFTSSEIEETRTLADRALVLCQGRISAEFRPANHR